jgi:V/A-type H+/Na+-transporting ATPase subunit F
MFKMAAFGTDEFVLGFQLAGIRETIVADENPENQVRELMKSGEIGIVIIDEPTLNRVSSYTKTDIMDSVKPVFIMLSDKAEDESLRRMIRKSIGVDLWEK